MITHCVSWNSREADRTRRLLACLLLILALQFMIASCEQEEDWATAASDQHGRMYDQ